MHHNYDISIIVPGIRNDKWLDLAEQISKGCKRYKYEIIFCGPHPLPSEFQYKTNVKYIKDMGTPTRALHLSTLIAEGRFFTWLSDDSWIYEDSIDMALDWLRANNPEKDIICVRYTEGKNHTGNEFPRAYWTAGYHDDLHQPGIDPNWNFAPVMLISLQRYRELGGIDTAYEHLNMNIIDFTFRSQRDGGKVLMSPVQIMNCDHDWDGESAIAKAFFENDRPLFREHYKDTNRPTHIDPENWRNTDVVWKRKAY